MKSVVNAMLAVAFSAVAVASVHAGEYNPGNPQKCEPVVAAQLKAVGLDMATLKNTQWQANNFDHKGENIVSGYRFYGEPPQCEGDNIAVEMWENCGITNIYTTGECRIKGVPHYWF